MSDQLDRLKTSLADRYAIQRELGRGGMATVYHAEDLKHLPARGDQGAETGARHRGRHPDYATCR